MRRADTYMLPFSLVCLVVISACSKTMMTRRAEQLPKENVALVMEADTPNAPQIVEIDRYLEVPASVTTVEVDPGNHWFTVLKPVTSSDTGVLKFDIYFAVDPGREYTILGARERAFV